MVERDPIAEAPLTRSLSLEDSAAALRAYVEGGVFLTPGDPDGLPGDPDGEDPEVT